MRSGGFILLALVLVGFVFAPVWEERTNAILSRSVAVVDATGVIYEASFPQALPSYRFPLLFNINYSELSYPSDLDRELFDWAYGNASLLLGNVSSVGIVFAPLGIAVENFDPLADPLVSIVVERAQLYASARYDIVVTLIGSDASFEALVALLSFLESHGIWYGLYGFSHGVVDPNSGLHGIVVYSGVSGVTIVNGEVLRGYLGSVSRVNEFVWVACGIEDEFEAFGESSFAGFFASAIDFRVFGRGATQIPQQVIDLFDVVVSEYSEVTTYPVAIVANGTVIEGELEITVNATVEFVEVSTNASLGLSLGRGSRYVKRYKKSVCSRVRVRRGAKYGKRVYGRKPPSTRSVGLFSRGLRRGADFISDGGSGLPSFSEIAELNRLEEFARGIDSVLGGLEEEFDAVKAQKIRDC